MTTDRILQGKVVVVTGAGAGIGRDLALAMAREGARVVVNDVGDAAHQVVAEIRSAGGEALASVESVSEAAAAQRIVDAAVEAFGRIDGVVNNAGILRDRIFHKMGADEWDAVIRVHLYGSYYVSRAAANHFKEQGGNQGIAAPAQATELPPAQEADVIPAPTPEQAPQDFIPEMAGMFEMDRGLDVVQYASVEPLELYAAPEIDFGSMLSVSSLSAYHLV